VEHLKRPTKEKSLLRRRRRKRKVAKCGRCFRSVEARKKDEKKPASHSAAEAEDHDAGAEKSPGPAEKSLSRNASANAESDNQPPQVKQEGEPKTKKSGLKKLLPKFGGKSKSKSNKNGYEQHADDGNEEKLEDDDDIVGEKAKDNATSNNPDAGSAVTASDSLAKLEDDLMHCTAEEFFAQMKIVEAEKKTTTCS